MLHLAYVFWFQKRMAGAEIKPQSQRSQKRAKVPEAVHEVDAIVVIVAVVVGGGGGGGSEGGGNRSSGGSAAVARRIRCRVQSRSRDRQLL